jgi:hypothetical protein
MMYNPDRSQRPGQRRGVASLLPTDEVIMVMFRPDATRGNGAPELEIRVHYDPDLRPEDVTTVDGIPVTTPTATGTAELGMMESDGSGHIRHIPDPPPQQYVAPPVRPQVYPPPDASASQGPCGPGPVRKSHAASAATSTTRAQEGAAPRA